MRLNKYISTQILFKTLQRNNWFTKVVLKNKINHVKRFFFVNKHVKNIFNDNFEIVVMNCIYEINKYKMSLMIIMKHISLKTFFYIDFVFIEKKEEKNFTWMLKQLKKLYDSLKFKHFKIIIIDRNLILMTIINKFYSRAHYVLCIWHINKNDLINCKQSFVTVEKWKKFLIFWYVIVYAHTREKYDKI